MTTVAPASLLAALEKAQRGIASYFTLLWSYFEAAGVTRGETELFKRPTHPIDQTPADSQFDFTTGGLAKTASSLAELPSNEARFDGEALLWMRALDRRLLQVVPKLLHDLRPLDIEGEPRRLCRRNLFIARHTGAVDGVHVNATWIGKQPNQLESYAPWHRATKVGPRAGHNVRWSSPDEWLGAFLRRRLDEAKADLRIMCWPFDRPIVYPAMEHLGDSSWIQLDAIANDEELAVEVERAILAASGERAAALIFPELSFSPRMSARAAAVLASRVGRDGFPILTSFGCCHAPSANEPLWLNEAVILGPDGRELHRHRKLAPFSMNVRGTTVGERLDAGSVLSVLEAPIGNLAPLICLDLFNEALAGLIQESTADVFFVPSLSPKTSAHQHAAKRLRVTSLASTFVCNRKLDDNRSGDEDARSFYVVPGRGKDVQYHPDDSSFLLFAADGTSQDK